MLRADMLREPGTAQAGPPDWPAQFLALAEQARHARLKAYYAAGTPAPETALAQTALTALDVETTGLDPAVDGIVSIGLVPMQLDRIQSSRSRHWLVKPRAALGSESVTIHGITDSQIRHAPDLEQILGELLEAIAGQVLVVHCRDIERRFLDAALRTRIGEGIRFPVIDTMELEARLHRGQRQGLLDRMLGRKPPWVSIRLADSRARYGLPRYRPHHAMTDALASAELLQAQVAYHYASDTPVSALWS
jgi:DNA polymerase III subunit epsilon